MGKDVIIALDLTARRRRWPSLIASQRKPFVKIGMELFYAEGPSIVREIKARGHKIFLDLKLHDIPNTVKKAMAALSSLDVDIVNLHAAGTAAMMSAALEGPHAPGRYASDAHRRHAAHLHQPAEHGGRDRHPRAAGRRRHRLREKRAGRRARRRGLLAARGREDPRGLPGSFVTVTPGIRFADAKTDDQVRITTPPEKARAIGSDYIVVGRPITQAADPVAAYQRCLQEFVG